MDNPANNNYSLWGNATGWIVAFFLTKKALADRDKRLDNNDEWKKNTKRITPISMSFCGCTLKTGKQ